MKPHTFNAAYLSTTHIPACAAHTSTSPTKVSGHSADCSRAREEFVLSVTEAQLIMPGSDERVTLVMAMHESSHMVLAWRLLDGMGRNREVFGVTKQAVEVARMAASNLSVTVVADHARHRMFRRAFGIGGIDRIRFPGIDKPSVRHASETIAKQLRQDLFDKWLRAAGRNTFGVYELPSRATLNRWLHSGIQRHHITARGKHQSSSPLKRWIKDGFLVSGLRQG